MSVRPIIGDLAVLKRRADQAGQCECLAAWLDDHPCICGADPIDLPLDRAMLAKAAQISANIDRLDREIGVIEASDEPELPCHYSTPDLGRLTYGERSDFDRHSRYVALPKAVLLAVLRQQRRQALAELAATGLVSLEHPYIRVNPA